MFSPIVQSAINVSEGRDSGVIGAVIEAAGSISGVTVADWSADPDHNRMVVSLLGAPDAVGRGAVAAARAAVGRIDLRHHTGAHPRLGAVDVIPFVPIRGVSMEECIRVSRDAARALASDPGLPVYLYEFSAHPGRHFLLPDIRKGGFEGLFTEPLTGPRAPDFGPGEPHPSAGAVVIGARRPLTAYNVNLESPDVAIARSIAARIRAERDTNAALAGVRALGLRLPIRGVAQVSLNLTRPEQTPLPGVFDFIHSAAREQGVEVRESEIIGLISRRSLGGEGPDRIRWHDFREAQWIDTWMERL